MLKQDERKFVGIVDDFPFMLSPSKHSERFFSTYYIPVGNPQQFTR